MLTKKTSALDRYLELRCISLEASNRQLKDELQVMSDKHHLLSSDNAELVEKLIQAESACDSALHEVNQRDSRLQEVDNSLTQLEAKLTRAKEDKISYGRICYKKGRKDERSSYLQAVEAHKKASEESEVSVDLPSP